MISKRIDDAKASLIIEHDALLWLRSEQIAERDTKILQLHEKNVALRSVVSTLKKEIRNLKMVNSKKTTAPKLKSLRKLYNKENQRGSLKMHLKMP